MTRNLCYPTGLQHTPKPEYHLYVLNVRGTTNIMAYGSWLSRGCVSPLVRDWLLITGMGGGGGRYKTGGGGACEVLPLRKVGAEEVLAMLKVGGHKQFWGSFYAVAWSFTLS